MGADADAGKVPFFEGDPHDRNRPHPLKPIAAAVPASLIKVRRCIYTLPSLDRIVHRLEARRHAERGLFIRSVLQDISRSAIQGFANCIQRAETDGSGFAGFQDG